jgi:hypothetical protein
MTRDEIEKKIYEIDRYFKNSKYADLVKEASELYYAGEYRKLEQCLQKFPTTEKLLNDLIPILKGKSVFFTLTKIIEGKSGNDWTSLKGMNSLLTHVIIECERGNTEYLILVHMLYERIGQMIANVGNFNKSYIEVETGA